MANAPTPAFVKYLAGEVEDALDAVYKDDATPVGRAYRDKFQFVVQTYCQQHDQAGEQTAAFVREIPCNEQFDLHGAIGGLIILRQTHEALTELLQDDADFKASYRGEEVTDDETDRHVRKTARDYERDTQVSEDVNGIVRKTAVEGEATDEEFLNASYDSDNGAAVEFDIALSARDRLEPKDDVPATNPVTSLPAHAPGGVPVQAHDVPVVEPSAPVSDGSTLVGTIGGLAVHESSRREQPAAAVVAPASIGPERIAIVPQTHFGGSPSVVFNRAKEWFADMIVKIAAGSERRDDFPRIAPLVDKKEFEQHGTTREELVRLAREIRDMTRRLRPPLSERHDDLLEMMERSLKPGGKGPTSGEMEDILDSFTGMFGKRDEDKYGLGLNQNWADGNDEDE